MIKVTKWTPDRSYPAWINPKIITHFYPETILGIDVTTVHFEGDRIHIVDPPEQLALQVAVAEVDLALTFLGYPKMKRTIKEIDE